MAAASTAPTPSQFNHAIADNDGADSANAINEDAVNEDGAVNADEAVFVHQPNLYSDDDDDSIDEQFWEDLNECGDGGDSDVEGPMSLMHSDAARAKTVLSTSGLVVDSDEDEIDNEGVPSEGPVADAASVTGSVSLSSLPGAPKHWMPPKPSDNWVSYSISDKKFNAPDEGDIDNPGNWHLFSFRPKYDDKKKYVAHVTPGGAQVLPPNNIGQRVKDGWQFFYNGWTLNDFDKKTFVRVGATKEDIKPASRQGCLDVDILKKHGLTAERVRNDPLWFFQMLFPLFHTNNSPVESDNRIPFFTQMTWYTHIYAAERGASLGFGHQWVPPDVAEMVKWTAVPIRHGSLDGSPGSLNCRWKRNDPRYDGVLAEAMQYSRYRQIKRYMKLNNNATEKPRTSVDFDPCNKYDLIFKVLCHNMNYCTRDADLDVAVDESTWGFAGYSGEAGWRLMNKPVSKGGQTTMLYDVSRCYPRHYLHRHKLMDKRRPVGFNQEGPAEIVCMVDAIEKLIKKPDLPATNDGNNGNEPDEYDENDDDDDEEIPHPSGKLLKYKKKRIFSRAPHIVADNYFSGEHVLDYVGRKGFGMTGTIRRDRIPKLIKPYVHHTKVTNYDQKSRMMRFQNPIVAVKRVEQKDGAYAYTKTWVSFQSTGATNITGVNNLPSCQLYVGKKERGRKEDKVVWGIEQHEAHATYLGHYYGIDIADHLISNANIKFISWKFWHMPYLHALSMGVLAAYDMYCECCDGGLDSSWRIDPKHRMSFAEFRQVLSKQMLEYDPAKLKYMGDELSRVVTQLHKKRNRAAAGGIRQQRKREEESYYIEGGMTVANLVKAMQLPRFSHVGNLNKLKEHFSSIAKKSNKMICEVCGEPTYWKCELCNKPLCTTDGAHKWNGAQCAMTFHNPSFWGLARSDVHLHKTSTWHPPTKQMVKRNEEKVTALQLQLQSIEMGQV